MFAYCGNNPTNKTDSSGRKWFYTVEGSETIEVSRPDEGTVEYKTIINYSAFAPNPYLLCPDPVIHGTVELLYTVDSRGVIILDTQQNSGGYLGDDAITEALASEMLNVAIRQVPGALSGRTPSGLAFEIRCHYKTSTLIPLSALKIADMGGLTGPGYDYNARGFENIWQFPSVFGEMFVERVWKKIVKAFSN